MDKELPRLILLIDSSRASERAILFGVAKYSRHFGPWMLTTLPAFPGLSRLARHRTVRAQELVANGIITSAPKVAKAVSRKVPTIGIAVSIPIPGVPNIRADAEAIAAVAIEHFLQRGYKQFAYCGFGLIDWAVERAESLRQQLLNAGHPLHCYKSRANHAVSWHQDLRQIGEWLQTLALPIALLACNDERARQVSDACQLVGLRVPQDIAILGVDNDELICVCEYPALSSVAVDFEQAGFEAAALLHECWMASRKKPGNQEILAKPTHVMTRQSTDSLAIADPVVAEAVRFIRANCRRPIQVQDVLGVVTVSRRSLYDRFKRALNCSVYEYIKAVRVAEIEHLLLDTSYSINEIADLVGFSSPDHIASYFRAVKGVNPLTLRLQHASRKTV